jgi:aminoglycoside 6'-N-acetyltransferase
VDVETIAILKDHGITLRRGSIVLRPLTEDDWDILHKWNSDPEVLFYSDGNTDGYGMEMVKKIYRGVCEHAFCFMIEYDGKSIGETYLQEMNLERILRKLPGKDLRRIDIMIGEKEFWGKGLGTEAVGMLVDFGFKEEHADAIFGCGVDKVNVRSFKMFRKLGFEVSPETGREDETSYDMVLTREYYEQMHLTRPETSSTPGS